MNKLTLVVGSAVVLGLGGSGCGTQAATLCSLKCDCEHCNDYAADALCVQADYDANRADAYGCSKEWESWATCVEDKGTCDEKEARFTTSQETAGSCTNEQTLGLDCTTNAGICAMTQPNAYCSGGTCKYKTCDNSGQPCTTSSECPKMGGKDRCADQRTDIEKCVQDNTAHKQQQPQPGSSGG